MRRICLFVALVATATAFGQAPDFGGKAQAEKMKALAFLEGRWEGEAWVNAQGRKIPLAGFEEVRLMAGGTCLSINAKWTMQAGERQVPVHEPFAMVYWDADKNGYRMLSQLANGLRNEYDLKVEGRGFTWSLNHPQMGEVRYSMTLSEAGEWLEKGEHKNADGTWTTALEMHLKKAGPTIVVAGVAAVAAAPSGDHPKFDPKADAAKDIAAGVARAKKEKKRVLLDVGGEWCIWCHRLDDLFTTNADVMKLLAAKYVVVKVNFSPENKNEAVLSKYPKISGYPHLFVLDADGKLLHSQDTGLLETGDHHDPDKVITFLKKWAP